MMMMLVVVYNESTWLDELRVDIDLGMYVRRGRSRVPFW